MTAGWLDPRPNDFSEEGLRARFKSLQDFLTNPTFVNGVNLGNGDLGTYDDTTGTTAPPSTSSVDADTVSGIQTDLTQLETDLNAAETDLTALEARFPIQEVDIGDDQISTPKLQANSVTADVLAAINIAVGKWIASTSYSAGSSGWIIEADGSAEFNDVTVRGTVIAEQFYGDADLMQSWDFTGSTQSWVAQGGGSVSVSSNTLLVDDDGANTHPEVLSPKVSGVTPGRVYRVTLEGDDYESSPSSFSEEIRFYTSGDVFISTGDWTESRQGNGVRSTIALAPATAAKLAIYVDGSNATEFAIDNVQVFECPTLVGAVIDTRPTDEPDAHGVRIGQGVHLMKGATSKGSLVWDSWSGSTPLPWTGEGPYLASASGASLFLTDDGHAVLDGDIVYIAPTGVDLRLGTGTGAGPDINVLGAWVSYTPSNSNITVGNGTQTAAYMLIGKTCHVRWRLSFGSTTAFATSARVGLPFAPVANQAGVANHADSGGRIFPGSCLAATSDSRAPLYHPESTNNGQVNATAPFTWGSGAVCTMSVTYEIA